MVGCVGVSLGRASMVPAQSDNAEAPRLPKLRLGVLHHQGRTVVHDGLSRARGRPEVRQLRCRGHGLAFVGRGQALRLRRPRKLLASRYPYSRTSWSTTSPKFAYTAFSRKFALPRATPGQGKERRPPRVRTRRAFASTLGFHMFYRRCPRLLRHPWACSFEGARTSMLPCDPEKSNPGRKGDAWTKK